MTYTDSRSFEGSPLMAGRAYDVINRWFGRPGPVGLDHVDVQVCIPSALEKRLRFVQGEISDVSMRLPKGFATGLNRQFANMMSEDAWEADDELISPDALKAFILLLLRTGTMRRPGIGTNGRGSITAAWTVGENRLTAECLPTGKVSVIVSRRGDSGEIERAAIGPVPVDRVRSILAPFKPEVWFDV